MNDELKKKLKSPQPNIPEYEEEIQKYWKEIDLNELIYEERKNMPRKVFLDGPPYPTHNTIHVGHARNKTTKDIYIRYNTLRGYDVVRIAGWDCHGLPIEVAVEKSLGLKCKRDIEEKIGVEKFVEECKKLASRNTSGLEESFNRLGVLMDWKRAYRTTDRDFMSANWEFFKKAYEKGLVKIELTPWYWCFRCQTVLSDYEVSQEYVDKEDDAIFVKFPVKDRENTYLIIWTTTPWTLFSNLAIAVNPEFEYIELDVGDETWIVAYDRLEELKKVLGLENVVIKDMKKGKDLEGLRYEFIFKDLVPEQEKLEEEYPRVHTVILADFVTLDEGTGLVHCAPGFGREDYEVCKDYGIPVFCPVREDGTFDERIKDFNGKNVLEANKEIIELLDQKGYLVFAHKYVHRVPLCWRCKTPLIFRASRQIMVKRNTKEYKEGIKKILDEVQYFPEEVKIAFFNIIDSMPDWVISRQRYWGTPIPLWICESCGHEKVFGSYDELEQEIGKKLEDEHRPYIDNVVLKCPKCGGEMKRVPDVFDVWVDSGCVGLAMEKRVGVFPPDFIEEGPDQLRGWFLSMANCCYVTKGQRPYNTLMKQGWVTTADGAKMSKSAGVGLLYPDQFSKIGGADLLRYYLLYKAQPWADIAFSSEELNNYRQFFVVLWNMFRFAYEYMSLDEFNIDKDYRTKYTLLDVWLKNRTIDIVREYIEKMDSYDYTNSLRLVSDFVVNDLSRFYLRLTRSRAWIEGDDPLKWSFYITLFKALRTVLLLLTPFIPHTTEFLYQTFVGSFDLDTKKSIQAEILEKPKEEDIDKKYLELFDDLRTVLEAGLFLRDKNKIKLRKPLKKAVIELKKELDEFNEEEIEQLKDIVREYLNVKEVELTKELPEGFEVSEDSGSKYLGRIGLDTTLYEDLILEWLTREIIRRIQMMRKELDLEIDDKIKTTIYTESNDLLKALEMFKDKIKEDTRSVEIEVIQGTTDSKDFKKWSIEGKEIYINIKKL